MEHRIKYYSKSDLSVGWNLQKIEEVIKEYDEKREDYIINDIIEFYNITKYLDNELYLKNWDKDYINDLKKINIKLKASIGRYFNNIKNKNIYEIFNLIEIRYKEDFFEIFENYKLYNRINQTSFNRLISNTHILELVLRNRKITEVYTDIIIKKFQKYNDSALILMNKYVLERNDNEELYIPKKLTIAERENIFIKYIKSREANLNYLRVILNIESNPNVLLISDKTKLLAKKRIDRDTKKFFEKNKGIGISTLVSFKEGAKDTFSYNSKGMNIECEYDLNWIKENNDYPTLLNNFIYLFEFVDMETRINLVNKKSEDGLFEKLSIRSKKEYKCNETFQRKSMLSSLQIMAYYKQLNNIGIKLEKIIEWFFKRYLKDEFKIKSYKINVPTEGSTYLEKCRNILIEMDYILKEYKLFVEERKINQELLEMSSSHLFFQDIPSIVKKKYVYASSEEYNLVSYYFFSDQCMLAYLERIGEKYENFYSLVINEKVKLEEYPEYDQRDLKELIKMDYIDIDKEGYLTIKDLKKVNIFKDLYYNDVISYWKYSKTARKIMDELCEIGILKFESTLLSTAESEYFNYYLNKASFVNGFDLRNKYIHGCQPNGKDSEKIHESNYYLFLKLLILLIIKINDDLSIYDSEEYKNIMKIK